MKQFVLEFDEQEAQRQCLTYESAIDDRLQVWVEHGTPVISGNPGGLLVLAKILIQMALSPDYGNGFHVHLAENYDPDRADCLTVMLDKAPEA